MGIAVTFTDTQFVAALVVWVVFMGWLLWLLFRGWDD